MADEQMIEVRYAGMVVARSAAVSDQRPDGFFLGVSDPLPVGTVVNLTIGEAGKTGRVEQVVESTESTVAGMRIRFVDGASARPALAGARATPTASTASAASASPAPSPAASAAAVAVAEDEGSVDASGPTEAGGGGGRRRRRRR